MPRDNQEIRARAGGRPTTIGRRAAARHRPACHGAARLGWAAALLLIWAGAAAAAAGDWPMWRHDALRSATAPEPLPEKLQLQWTRDLPPLVPAFWQVRQERVQFDLGYEPVVAGRTLFVASSANDRVTAYDTADGRERWRFYAGGPVRLAPVALGGKVYFGSDDGYLYCLDAATGQPAWKVRGAPSARKVLGNGRLISVWPCRGGPVVAGGRVYFAAGVWPFEGIFVQALDAATGRSIWVNDRSGSLYLDHPHAAASFGGPSPQGYLLLHDGRLVMPGSRAFPAHFDPADGRLLGCDFGHGGHGSQPGGWFVATNGRGQLCVDPVINAEVHDEGKQVIGQRGIRRLPGEVLQETVKVGQTAYRVIEGAARVMRAGGKDYRFDDGFPGVEGKVHTMLAADGRLFVVTRAGRLYCFGASTTGAAPALHHPTESRPPAPATDAWGDRAEALVKLTRCDEGHALVLGPGTGRLAEELAQRTKLRIVALDPDEAKVAAFRRHMDDAGLYGGRIAALAAAPTEAGLPPYLASLVVCEDLRAAGFGAGEPWLRSVFETLRPYGGTLCLECTDAEHRAIEGWLKAPSYAGATLRRDGAHTRVVRGELPGATNYAGRANYDQRVRAPLGVLWFGDTLHHHKLFYQGYAHEGGRGLPPYIRVADGVMSYVVPTEPLALKDKSMTYLDFIRNINAKPHEPAYTDVYTGRVLGSAPPQHGGAEAAAPPDAPEPLTRTNPITGVEEAREYPKTFGCDQFGADYGNFITMRSGTAAFYDKRAESGTVNISGTRSGCRNSMVAACGVLSIPAWTGNCTCNYPVYTSMALATMPPEFEQWSAWGPVAVDAPVRRVGINFGAPGDRMAPDGTLWVDWPSVGGSSPDVRVKVAPETAEPFYRHALRGNGGSGWPWVFASGLRGVRAVSIDTTAHGVAQAGNRFGVRWTGRVVAPAAGEYTFHVRGDGPMRLTIDGRTVADSGLRVAKEGMHEASGTLALAAGTAYDLRLEYKHAPVAGKAAPGGKTPPAAPAAPPGQAAKAAPARAELAWSTASMPRTAIPAERLQAPDGRPGGLAGAYFASERLAGAALVQRDPQVKFDWGEAPPAILVDRASPPGDHKAAYTVRLVFAEPDEMKPGQRVFSVRLQGKEVLKDLDVAKEAGGGWRGIVREVRDVEAGASVDVELLPSTAAPPVLCGVELIARPAGPVRAPAAE